MAWFVIFACTVFGLYFWREHRVQQQDLQSSTSPLRTGERYIGQVLTLPEGLRDGSGQVKLGNRRWSLRGPNAPAGVAGAGDRRGRHRPDRGSPARLTAGKPHLLRRRNLRGRDLRPMRSPCMTFFDFPVTGIQGEPDLLGRCAAGSCWRSTWRAAAATPRSTPGSSGSTSELSSEGFAVVGFPCNQFGAQEPGSDLEIREFCSTRYDVTFPLAVQARGERPEPAPAVRVAHGAGERPPGRHRMELREVPDRSRRAGARTLSVGHAGPTTRAC